jgi:hypothetical protein
LLKRGALVLVAHRLISTRALLKKMKVGLIFSHITTRARFPAWGVDEACGMPIKATRISRVWIDRLTAARMVQCTGQQQRERFDQTQRSPMTL